MELRRKGSFTLIELLIAVTIFAIIAVAIYSTFNAGISVRQKLNPIIRLNQSRRLFFDIISQDLKNAVLYSKAADAKNFEGGPASVSFMTLINVYSAEGREHAELARVSYQYENNKVIRKQATKDEGFNIADLDAKSSELIDGLDKDDFEFEYCYREPREPPVGSDYSYEWGDSWEDENKLPRGVKVKIGEFEKTILIPMGELGA